MFLHMSKLLGGQLARLIVPKPRALLVRKAPPVLLVKDGKVFKFKRRKSLKARSQGG